MERAWILSSTRWCSFNRYIGANCHLVVERLAGPAVVQRDLSRFRQPRLLQRRSLISSSLAPVKNRAPTCGLRSSSGRQALPPHRRSSRRGTCFSSLPPAVAFDPLAHSQAGAVAASINCPILRPSSLEAHPRWVLEYLTSIHSRRYTKRV